MEEVEKLRLQVSAIEGFAKLGEYLATCDDLTRECVDSWYCLKDYLLKRGKYKNEQE